MPSVQSVGSRFAPSSNPFVSPSLPFPVEPNLSELLDVDFGEPLHSLVICGTTHPLEDELLKWHRVTADRIEKPPVKEDEAGAAARVAEAEAAVGALSAEGAAQEAPAPR